MNHPFKVGKRLGLSIFIIVLEGLLAGCNFLVLYAVLELLFGEGVTFTELMTMTAIVAGILFLRILLYSIGYTGSQIGGADVSRSIRITVGDKLKRIPLGLFSKGKIGDYISAATTEVTNYEQILTHKYADIIKYIILVVAVCVFVMTMHLPSGLVLLVASMLLVPAMAISVHAVKIYGNKKSRAAAENSGSITEYITGIQTLRSYGMGGTKNKTVTKVMKDYSHISYLFEKVIIPIGVVFSVLNWMSMPLCILMGGRAWLAGALSAPQLIMITMIPLFVCKLNGTLFIDLTAYRNLMISKNRIVKILDEQEEPVGNDAFIPQNREVSFSNVRFSYLEEEPVLEGVSFTAKPNSLTALVGDSGSGKSTIFNLISKYYPPESGSIRIGGCNTENAPAEQVLSYISMVDQDVFLFNDTVRNNIRSARPKASDAEVEEACRLASCDQFIRGMESGYESEIGENGNRLSGGERQRLSVARAILKDSPVILLDEATASLDIENELLVKQAITNLLKADKTVIMIAHTLPVIKNADQILVLDGGVIAESGTHDQLLALKGKYAAMWQASEELK